MGSKKSSAKNRRREVLAPQRRRGELRVASLLAAAAEVIADKGFEATTMAEISARGGAQIGSLYHFFPNKEALADALLQRFGELVEESFRKVKEQVAVVSTGALSDTLLGFLAALHGETRAVVALLEARSDWSTKRAEFRATVLGQIVEILLLRSPKLGQKTAQAVAIVVLHNMKAMKALNAETGTAASPEVVAELRKMNHLYLEHTLSKR
jgi:AcrR family transcriptional regulator